MKKHEDSVPFCEALRLHLRGFKLIHKRCKGLYLSIGLHGIVSAISPYVTVWFSARLIDEIAGACRPEMLVRKAVSTVLFTAVMMLLSFVLERWKETKYDNNFYYRKNKIYGDKLASLDYGMLDDRETQDLYHQIIQNENWNGRGLTWINYLYEELVRSTAGIVGAAVLAATLFTRQVPAENAGLAWLDHPLFALGMLLLLGAVAMIAPALESRAGRYHNIVAESARLANRVFGAFGFLSEDTRRAMDIRMYRQELITRKHLEKCDTFWPGGIAARFAAGPQGLLSGGAAAVSAVLTGIIYVYVCLKAWAGAFGIGAVTQYVGALTALMGSVSKLLSVLGGVRNNGFYLKPLFAFLDIPNAMYQGSLTTEKRSDRQYEVEFRNVSFRYPGAEVWALRNVSIKFRVGKRLAIVGENGSGKTTFIKLLCRLYDPQEGEILLNGIDIRKYNYRDYMDVFSVVFQDYRLLSQSLGSNVAGSAVYDEEQVRKALEDAGFGERLSRMEKGLDTCLYRNFGDDGVEVSGGEAQKIAIARALYKDAPFIILDEPTAALDPVAEAEIYSKFNDISGDKTAIYISHRLSSCKFCDEIAVFHHGEIIQHGTHDSLLADAEGKYHALWHAQAQYYTEKKA